MAVASSEAIKRLSIPNTTSTSNPKTAILEEISEALRIFSISNQRPKRHPSLLLALPAELRSAIYSAALFDNDNDLFLLRTCKQIYMEASPALYQRPVSFSSQAKLISWVEKSEEGDLKRVRTLSLRLTDIDMSSLFDAGPSRKSSSTTAWGLHQQELQKLDQALRSLPGLQHLTIIPPERNNSQLLRSMYLSLLEMIPVRLPSLTQLTIHDDESLVQKLSSLKQLSGRAWVVFDSSKAPRTADTSSSKDHSNWNKISTDATMVDGVHIKSERMDTD